MNLIDKLKNCPIGMELDCTMYDNVRFNGVTLPAQYPIEILIPGSVIDSTLKLTEEGKFNFHSNAKCVIFPKGKTSWDDFVPPFEVNEGDIIVSTLGGIHIMENRTTSYCFFSRHGSICTSKTTSVRAERFATKEEKEILFNELHTKGYQWNPETKTLEEYIAPIFKLGDKIQCKNDVNKIRIIDNVFHNGYTFKGYGFLSFKNQDEWELIPNKFDITKLIPFKTEVLVSDDSGRWVPAIFGYYDKNQSKPFMTVGGNSFNKCIPYKGNEHLRGTTNDCDKYFKVWE